MTMAPPRIVKAPRCQHCNKMQAEYCAVPYKFTCIRCGKVTEVLQ